MGLSSYPKIYNLGHPLIMDLLTKSVRVQEKIDGSQFSFGIDDEGVVFCRSKGAEVDLENPGMFAKAVQTVQALRAEGRLNPGWVYRAEFLQKPKHNALAYDRVPTGNIILFDIMTGVEEYSLVDLPAEAEKLGLEAVPTLGIYEAGALTQDELVRLLDRVSCLGGAKIEGVVIKNYRLFGVDGKPLMGKHVSEAFKEVHKGEWRAANPTGTDIIEKLIFAHRTPARWAKAIQHLSEAGKLQDAPQDIGLLMNEIKGDVEVECIDDIKEALWKWAAPKFFRGITSGFPEHYKQLLMEKQFTEVG